MNWLIYQWLELMESHMSMFIVQSGLIRRSLVAFSTATVAEEEEDKDIPTSVLRHSDETETYCVYPQKNKN